MMHDFWLVEDLVRCVLLQCNSLRDVSMLGRTCKLFFPLTLGLVWRNPPIAALIDILQPGSNIRSTFNQVQSSVPPPLESHALERFCIYAGHVQHLVLTEFEDGTHRAEGMNALSSVAVHGLISLITPIGPLYVLFARLQSVTIQAVSIRGFQLGVLLCPGDLPYLKLKMTSFPFMYENGYKVALGPEGVVTLADLLSKLPRIDVLHLSAWHESWNRDSSHNPLSDLLVALASHFPMIARVEANSVGFDSSFLSQLGTMPNIEELELTYRDMAPIPVGVNIGAFCLRRLDAKFKTGQQCLDFLQSLTSSGLVHIFLGLTALFLPETLDGIVTLVAETWPALKSFSMFWFDLNMATGLPAMLFTSFHPLLKCRSLETVVIRVRMGFDLTNHDLTDIGRSWHLLKHLTISGTADMRPVIPRSLPMNTLNDLSDLVVNCPDLLELSIPIALTASLDLIRPSSSKLRIFNIQDSPPTDAVEAAAALRRLFPKLHQLLFSQRLPIYNDPAFQVYDTSRKRFGEELQRRLGLSPS